jgi:hypothetical protein
MVYATTAGFIQPEAAQGDDPFVKYSNYQATYVIANHHQSDHYHDELKKVAELAEDPFGSAADVILAVVPKLRLHRLVVSGHLANARPFQSAAGKQQELAALWSFLLVVLRSLFCVFIALFAQAREFPFRTKIAGTASY